MSVWFTSDLHFGHRNIAGYCGRPYADVDTMNDAIIARINTHVRPGDLLYILGDVALGGLDESLPLVRKLAGTKILIPGNHDLCWTGHGAKAERNRDRYLNAGFTDILDNPGPLTLAGQRVHLSHFPYRGSSRSDHTATERYHQHRPIDTGDWLLCGHVHNLWKQNNRMINVGIDAWGGLPVHIDTLTQLIAAGRADAPADPWNSTTTRPQLACAASH